MYLRIWCFYLNIPGQTVIILFENVVEKKVYSTYYQMLATTSLLLMKWIITLQHKQLCQPYIHISWDRRHKIPLLEMKWQLLSVFI